MNNNSFNSDFVGNAWHILSRDVGKISAWAAVVSSDQMAMKQRYSELERSEICSYNC